MSAFGKIEEFDEGKDDWNEYVERFEQFFLANHIEDATKQKAILLSCCGSKPYSLFRNLLAPVTPSTKSYAELVQLMKGHTTPKPSIILERFNFFKRDRENGETISIYISELRKLARGCDFVTNLEDMLRDGLVCGVHNDKRQQKLLSETTLTFAQAVSTASAMERAEKNLRDLHESQQVSINSIKTQITCFRCGKNPHHSDNCRFKNAECYVCHKHGHIAPVCKQRTNLENPRSKASHQGNYTRPNRDFSTNCIEENQQRVSKSPDGEDHSEELYSIYTMQHKRVNPIKVILQLKGIPGASLSIINYSTFIKLQKKDNKLALVPTQVKFPTYTGEIMKVGGLAEINVAYKSQSFKQPVFVVDGNKPCLLGRDWLFVLQLDWAEIFSVSTHPINNSLEAVIHQYGGIFGSDLGTLKDYEAHIYLKKDARPKFIKARPVPYALKGKIEEELNRQVEAGILEAVDVSEWAAPIVPIR